MGDALSEILVRTYALTSQSSTIRVALPLCIVFIDGSDEE